MRLYLPQLRALEGERAALDAILDRADACCNRCARALALSLARAWRVGAIWVHWDSVLWVRCFGIRCFGIGAAHLWEAMH
eukprot:5519571-Prymnesium_polylepis.1